MNAFRALIFDVDGTMAETEELHRRAFNEAFEYFRIGWFWDVRLYRKLLVVTGGKERIARFQDEHVDDGARLNSAQIGELHRFKTARYTKLVASGGCPLRPGVSETIAAAERSGKLLAIATTTSRENVDALLATALGPAWQRRFLSVVTGEDVALKKPAPDVYLKVLQALNLPATACVAFEDSRNGLLAARSAGIPVVISRSRYFDHEEFEGALRVVQDLSELTTQY